MKHCKKCETDKPLDDFYDHPRGKFGKQAHCIDCTNEYKRAWREENAERLLVLDLAYRRKYDAEHKEAVAATKLAWARANPDKRVAAQNKRRSRILSSTEHYTSEEWQELCKKYGNACLACGRVDRQLSVDHVIPLSKGGSNAIDNIQPLCRPCNSSKNAKIIDYRLVMA